MIKFIRRSHNCFKKIKVPEEFKDCPPNPHKVIEKTALYFEKNKLDTIYVDKKFNLLDGYCSYLIAKTLGIKRVKIMQVREKYCKNYEADASREEPALPSAVKNHVYNRFMKVE